MVMEPKDYSQLAVSAGNPTCALQELLDCLYACIAIRVIADEELDELVGKLADFIFLIGQ
jgi:hypothetical protein